MNNKLRSERILAAEAEATIARRQLEDFLRENVGSAIVRYAIMAYVDDLADKHAAIVQRKWDNDVDAGLKDARANVSGILSDLLNFHES